MITLSINDWWLALNGTEQIFWAMALLFSVVFVLVFIVSLLGFDSDSDIDLDVDTDIDGNIDFPVFSVKSITAFFTFFSWTGVLLLGEGKSLWQLLPYSIISGLVAMFLVVVLVKQFNKMTEMGNADLLDLIFEKGDVYLSIPPAKQGKGKIHITLNKSLRELNAVTEGPTIQSGEKVRIIEVLNDNSLLVEKIDTINS
ncbi:hypothetical protein [Membranihabitans maritimus]|uniref:hypothetical protein n=1 Tax=Membranihabitans maritimus TaxID=2904244 RepID=UPI001F18E2F9|nr:hypothetical protein [Membranihabitans maritimus]